MGLIEWENKRIKNLDVWDIGLTKLSIFFFTLMLVNLWPMLAGWYKWYWYLVAALIVAIRPVVRFFR